MINDQNKMQKTVISLLIILTIQFLKAESSIIPVPRQVDYTAAEFRLSPITKILVSPETMTTGHYLADIVNRHTNWNLAVELVSESNSADAIQIVLDPTLDSGSESYQLEISDNSILLSAAALPGLFYGCQTFRQLLPYDSSAVEMTRAAGFLNLPGMTIDDAPRFAWRGMMLDVSRHFFPKEFIKELIDYLSYHKLNMFHWHLVDDQGWRIEIKKYPRLTEIGAWRVERPDEPWARRELQQPDEIAAYGGFYTQDDIREIVRYAQECHITIVPEIEMPAHVTSALAAYPELSCTGGPFTVPPGSIWPLKDIYCAGRDSTFEFLEHVLSEVIDLFPGKYIHIGGDECRNNAIPVSSV